MALITCPECGREVSDKASVCPHCGYPINSISGGIFRIGYKTFLKNTKSTVSVEFEGQTVELVRDEFVDFPIPADGMEHIAKVHCKVAYRGVHRINIKVRSGESKKATLIYNDANMFMKWQCKQSSIL